MAYADDEPLHADIRRRTECPFARGKETDVMISTGAG